MSAPPEPCVYRATIRNDGVLGEPEELIDLRPLRFEAVPPSVEATTWHLPVTGRRIR
jgi:hypothetical protein